MDNTGKKIRIIQLVLLVLVVIMAVVIMVTYQDTNFPNEASTTFTYDEKGRVVEKKMDVVIEQPFVPDEKQTAILQALALSYYEVELKSYELTDEFKTCVNPFNFDASGKMWWYYCLWEYNNDNVPILGDAPDGPHKLIDLETFNKVLQAGHLQPVEDVAELQKDYDYYDEEQQLVHLSYGNELEGWIDYANILSAIQYKEDLIIVQLEVGVNQVTYDADANPTDNITPIYNVVLKVRQSPESVLGGFVVESIEYMPL